MADAITVKVEGIDSVKQMFNEIGYQLSQREMVGILRPAGREVVKAARNKVPQQGEIKRAVKRDISIVKARVVKGQAEVNVGLKFGYYDINNQVQKVAPIAQHMTEGFIQTNRTGAKSGAGAGKGRRNRGKVKSRTGDFIEEGFNASMSQQMAAINEGIDKKIVKIKAKYGV